MERDKIDKKYKWDLSEIYGSLDEYKKDIKYVKDEIKKISKYEKVELNENNLYETLTSKSEKGTWI